MAYLRVPVSDLSDQDLRRHLPAAVRFIDEALAAPGAQLLVHCRHGQSRSAAVLAAWLMRGEHGPRLTGEAALRHLVACRPRVSINDGFRAQLELPTAGAGAAPLAAGGRS